MELIDGLEVNPAACETTHPRKYKVYSSSTSLLGFQLLMILTALIGSCTLSMNIFLMRIFHVTNGGIKSVKFSSESGLWFKDDVVFAEMLKTSQLSHISHHRGIDGFVISSGRDMHIESNARRTGKVNSLTLSDGSFDVRGNLFAVHSTYSNEDVIFQAGIEEVLISASDVPIAASAGFTLQGSLISNTIRGDPNHDFRVGSPTGKVTVQSGGDTMIVSKSEYLLLKSSLDMDVKSANGAIILGSQKVEIKNLPVSELKSVRARREVPDSEETSFVDSGSDVQSFALCSCKSGKIFYVSEEENCNASLSFCKDQEE